MDPEAALGRHRREDDQVTWLLRQGTDPIHDRQRIEHALPGGQLVDLPPPIDRPACLPAHRIDEPQVVLRLLLLAAHLVVLPRRAPIGVVQRLHLGPHAVDRVEQFRAPDRHQDPHQTRATIDRSALEGHLAAVQSQPADPVGESVIEGHCRRLATGL